MNSMNKLQENWLKVSKELGIKVVPDFVLELRSSKGVVVVKSDLFVESFGMSRGMLVVTDYNVIAANVCDLIELGYGFSILDQNDNNHDKEFFMNVLRDWGWSGDKELCPEWY